MLNSEKPQDNGSVLHQTEMQRFYRSKHWFAILFHNKYFFLVFIGIILAAAYIGLLGAYLLAQGQWLLGLPVLIIWAPVYWLFMSHLNSRKVMRLEFSIPLTLFALALVFYIGSHIAR